MKKIPPWGWALGAVGLGAAFYLYKKSKEKAAAEAESKSESPTESPVVAGVENPAEEFPYSIGGLGGGGAGAIGNALESGQELRELFGTQATQQKEFETSFTTSEQEFNQKLLQQLREAGEKTTATPIPATVGAGSGGGTPATPTPGVVTAQPPVTAAPTCPPAFAKHNGANGPPSPRSCYRESRETCKSGKCHIHGYQDGHEVCPC